MSKPTAWSYSRLNNYETCPKKYWHLAVKKDVIEHENETIQYGKTVHKALEKRVGKGKPLPLHLRYLEPYANKLVCAEGEKLTEQQLAINSSFQPCGWFAKDAWCRAILDLVITNPPHGIVVDYKTGRINDDFTQLELAGALLMLHMPEIQTLDLCYMWTKDKRVTKGDRLERSEIKRVISDLMPRVQRYEKAHRKEEFPARPGGLCKKYCPIKTCPHNGE